MAHLRPGPAMSLGEHRREKKTRGGGVLRGGIARQDSKFRGAKATGHPKVLCHFYAEMDQPVVRSKNTTLAVVVSREVIEQATGKAAASAHADLDAHRKIIVEVRPRRNFEIAGDNRIELDPPVSDEIVERYFDLVPTHPGEGEVWVVARQGQVPLVTLKLKVRIVERQPKRKKKASVKAATAELPVIPEPLRQLRIFERVNGEFISYEYDLAIPGVIVDHYESKPIKTGRQQYVDNLYQEIEQRWASSDDDVDAFYEELRAMGGELFDELFPEELQRHLWQYREQIENIQVISTEPFIPWELVHLKEPNQPLPEETCFLGQIGLVRWLHGAWPPEKLRLRNGHVRYVIPDYSAFPRNVIEELPILSEAGKEAAFRRTSR